MNWVVFDKKGTLYSGPCNIAAKKQGTKCNSNNHKDLRAIFKNMRERNKKKTYNGVRETTKRHCLGY